MLSIFLAGCINIKPTYKREKIIEEIKKITQEEFSLKNVVVKEVKNTLYVYAPFKRILNDDLTWDEDVLKKTRYLSLTINRVLLSVDSPPEFYVIIISDIEHLGADFVQIGYFPDLKKFYMNYISYSQLSQRIITRPYLTPYALGDEEGKHIKYVDIKFADFLCGLISQYIQKFLQKRYAHQISLKEVAVNYKDKTIYLNIDADARYAQNIEEALPLEEILKIVAYYLKIYDFWNILGADLSLKGKTVKFLSRSSLRKIETFSQLPNLSNE